MKIGDVSRPRRFADSARLRWYAYHRAVRFALRMNRMTSRRARPLSLSRVVEETAATACT